MNSYHIVIDDSMIRNTLQTDLKESMDLFSIKQLLYFVVLGLVPAYLVYKMPISYGDIKTSLFSKLKQSLFLLAIILLSIFLFSKHYASFAREHKPLRYSTNPTYWMYSIGNYINKTANAAPIVISQIGLDAKITKAQDALPKLIILVVGEAVRADHLGLNGYHKETTPQLKKEDIINLPNVYSCGTSTAVSVPCMFSIYTKSEYSYKKGIRRENVLDVLKHTNDVSILWRDNNSDSKGVALRVPYQHYKTATHNTVCNDDECRDEGLLVGLETHIKNQKNKDILIVLHQMGNHGPAYYKRYPKAFEKFTPTCKTNQLEECTQEEISNAYDNTLLYTDDFLTKAIRLLEKHNPTHQTAMLYMSDHGESLGENGIYLHGLPYFMAPNSQTHIGAFVWFGSKFKQSISLKNFDPNKRYTHDYLFHTLLGLFDVSTKVYNKQLDMFN